VTELWPEASRPLVQAAIDEARAGRTARYTAFGPTAKGTPRWWDVTVTPLPGAEGEAPRLLSVARDITERKATEAALARHTDDLERLVGQRTAELRESEARLAQAAKMEALGRLAGGVAHDFNNVLQSVQGGIALARKRLNRSPEDAERFLDLASDAAARGASVTGRLLSFARRGELQVAPVEPAPMLEGLAEMLRATLGPSVSLRVEAPAGLPAMLADAGQLEAVLVNLANNARDALPDGAGTVTLAASPAPSVPGHLPPGDYLRVAVIDDGEGMGPEVLARVAEPFFTTKPKGRGTGLGLAMARGFAEQSGGTLTIESAHGRGTTVSLWLPLATHQADMGGGVEPGADRHGAPALESTSLLVVDDEPGVRMLLATAMSEFGHCVEEAEDGAAALGRLDLGIPVSALVTDLAMPGGMDGLALIREARKRRPGLPAVLVTGHLGDATHGALEEAAGSGPLAVLRKPVSPEAVEAQIAVLLGTAANRPPPAGGPVLGAVA
jgi:signal transduction histidine kinase/CheY-like chemotaxis protein